MSREFLEDIPVPYVDIASIPLTVPQVLLQLGSQDFSQFRDVTSDMSLGASKVEFDFDQLSRTVETSQWNISEYDLPSTRDPNTLNTACETIVRTGSDILDLLINAPISTSTNTFDQAYQVSSATSDALAGPAPAFAEFDTTPSIPDCKDPDQTSESLYMTDSSPASDLESQETSLNDSVIASSNADGHHFQLQEYYMPHLAVFGRRVGQEDDSSVDDQLKVSEMLPYPDATPIITLGRGKKKMRSLSQMSHGEVHEALTGLARPASGPYFEQQAIKDWSGACSSAILAEENLIWPLLTPPESSVNVASSTANGFVNPAKATSGVDWKAKNKLQLTVNTNLNPFRNNNHLSAPPTSSSSISLNQSDGHSPAVNYNNRTSLTPQFETLMGAIKSAPLMRPGQTSTSPDGYFGFLPLPTPPHTANWTESHRGQPAFSICKPSDDLYTSGMEMRSSGPAHIISNCDMGADYLNGLPTPSSAISTTFAPQASRSPIEVYAQSLGFPDTCIPVQKHTPSFLPPTPCSATPAAPFDFDSTFGLSPHVTVFPEQMIRSHSTSQLDSVSNFPLGFVKPANLYRASSEKRVLSIPREIEVTPLPVARGNYKRHKKENDIQLSTGDVSIGKGSIVGSRLKPGPKSKSTLVQHPPPIPNLSGLVSVGESGGISKEILRCLYEPIHQRIEDANGVPSINKRYICKIEACGRTFPRKTAVESHIQTHLEDKPFVCPVNNCNAAFVRQHDLRRHEQIHSGKKPYNCECGKGFARGDALMRHRQRGICVGSTIPRRC